MAMAKKKPMAKKAPMKQQSAAEKKMDMAQLRKKGASPKQMSAYMKQDAKMDKKTLSAKKDDMSDRALMKKVMAKKAKKK